MSMLILLQILRMVVIEVKVAVSAILLNPGAIEVLSEPVSFKG